MRKTILHILILTILTSVAHSQSLIHASATIGEIGQKNGGGAITAFQFLGTRFELTSLTNVTAIGGHFFVPSGSNGEMFGTIMRLDLLSSLPTGNPFDSADLSRVMLSTVVTVSSSSSIDYKFPVSVTLEPGSYALIFGKGQFGASSSGSVGAAEGSQNLSPNYMAWHDSNTPGWGNGGFPNARLTVYSTLVPEPCAAHLILISGVIAAMQQRRKVALA